VKAFKNQGINVKNGVIDLFGERIVLFPPSIISLLSSIYGEGAMSLLVFLGKKMGRRLSENWDENLKPNTLEQFTTIICQFMSTCGWEKFDPYLITEQQIIVHIGHNVNEELEVPSKHICYFIRGLLLVFGEYALYRADVQKLDCSIENEKKHCVFEIRKKMWHLIPTQPLLKLESLEDVNIK
jgi:predicted hydrocarbon binding protein